MSVVVQMENVEELAYLLAELPRKLSKAAAVTSLMGAAQPMVGAMRAAIHSDTGRLKAGLAVRPGRGDRPGRTSVVISSLSTRARVAAFEKRPDLRLKGSARSKMGVHYSIPLEMGHGGPRPAPPHPFAGPAFDAHAESAAEKIETDFLEELHKATGLPVE